MAPSPTGFFHIGSARTALYNWLFARRYGGKFIIRVEDTDATRSSKEMIDVILDALKWLDLDYDEGPEKGGSCGPYYQSERKELYHQYVPALIESGHAYWCFCTTEEIAREREEAIKKIGGWQYDRRCLRLPADEVKKRLASGMAKTLRFRIPDNVTVGFEDLIHGRVEKMSKELEDFIIIKSDGMPTYNYACVVDDRLMDISHVIRGVEHIANTPKQVLLYEALKWTAPEFAHLPVILGPDKKKLSKRLGARSVLEYRDDGYLPETVVNILGLLGWSPGGDVEIMDRKFMTDNFSLDRINPANAVFDEKRLEWMNNHYIINRLPDERFLGHTVPYLIQAGLVDAGKYDQDREYKNGVDRVCNLMRARLKVLQDITKVRYFFADDFEYDKKSLDKHLKSETITLVKEYMADLKKLTEQGIFDSEALNKHLRQFAQDRGFSPAKIIHPLRVYITGVEDGPGLFEAMELIGKKRCLERISAVVFRSEESHAEK
jgi:glutamyl-tRNA synthetase